jgi:hypothetical protein
MKNEIDFVSNKCVCVAGPMFDCVWEREREREREMDYRKEQVKVKKSDRVDCGSGSNWEQS